MSSRSVPKVQRADCSGHITAVGTGLMLTALVFFLFYLLSGPPTFLTLVQLSGGDTAFFNVTFSQTWCECLQLASKNNASVDDITLFRLPPDASPPLSRRFQYSVVQHVRDPNLAFEYWQATLHLGASGVASFSFSHPVNVYFVSAFYANGQGHDPDYSYHYVSMLANVTEGVLPSPPITEANASVALWAWVFEKDFRLQEQTTGLVTYDFDMVEYALPARPSPNDTAVGWGRFCWASDDQSRYSWLLSAAYRNGTVNVEAPLSAALTCVPRYSLTIPILCIPAVLAVVIEILIVVFCIVRPARRARALHGYSPIA